MHHLFIIQKTLQPKKTFAHFQLDQWFRPRHNINPKWTSERRDLMRLMLLICPLVLPEADFFSTDCRGAGCVVTTPSRGNDLGAVVVIGIVVVVVVIFLVVVIVSKSSPLASLNLVLFLGDCLFVCLRQGGRGWTTSSPDVDVVGEIVIDVVVVVVFIVISGRECGRGFFGGDDGRGREL